MGKSNYTTIIQAVTSERFNRRSNPKGSGFPLKACGNDEPPERHNGMPNQIFGGDDEDHEVRTFRISKFEFRNFLRVPHVLRGEKGSV